MAIADSDAKVEAADVHKSNRLQLLVASAAFFLIVTGATLFLQVTLLAYSLGGWYLHWASILLFVPLLVGLGFKAFRTAAPGVAAFLGGILSAAVVYPCYKYILFKEPPHPLAGVLFALITAGVAYAGSTRIRRKVREIQEARKDEGILLQASDLLRDPRYSAVLASAELLISLLSLAVSIWGIVFVARR